LIKTFKYKCSGIYQQKNLKWILSIFVRIWRLSAQMMLTVACATTVSTTMTWILTVSECKTMRLHWKLLASFCYLFTITLLPDKNLIGKMKIMGWVYFKASSGLKFKTCNPPSSLGKWKLQNRSLKLRLDNLPLFNITCKICSILQNIAVHFSTLQNISHNCFIWLS